VEGETVTLDPIYKNILFLSMLVSAWAFFGWFWTHSGQTLGMQAWRLKVVTREGEKISVAQSIARFLLAIPAFLMVGIGYFYMYLNPERETLHGKLSGTKVVLVPLMEKKQVD
ncbi:MAG: RDD family protein, partial [Pseudohongiellaceae bacterium]